MVSASLGASLDLNNLLVYPIPRDKLFMVEVLLRVANAAEMLMVLIGGLAGLLFNPALGRWALAPGVLACLLLFTGFNLLLSAGMSNLKLRNAQRWLSATESPVWPWTAASHLATGPHEIFALVTMIAWAVLALAFGRWQFGRSLD